MSMQDAHARDGLDVLHYFNVNASEGLSDEQVRQQQLKYGKNVLEAEEGESIDEFDIERKSTDRRFFQQPHSGSLF